MCAVLLKNVSIIYDSYSRRLLRGRDIFVGDNGIESILEGESPSGSKRDFVVDCSGKAVTQGLGNSHTHLGMTLLRGHADGFSLRQWLNDRVWPIERRLRPEHIRTGVELGLTESIRAGVTGLTDMYFSSQEVARAAASSGLRVLVAPAIFDTGVPDSSLNNCLSVINSQPVGGLVSFALGPHSIYACSEETLMKVGEFSRAKSLRVHIHLAETRLEQVECERSKGMREVEYLRKMDLLSKRLTAAHAVWITKQEANLLGKAGASSVFCPVSNSKLAEGGISPVPELLAAGTNVSFGTDGPASNNSLSLIETMKFGSLLLSHSRWDPQSVTPSVCLEMATKNAYAAMDFPENHLAPGGPADLIAFDLRQPGMLGALSADFPNLLVYSGPSVDHVIVNGQPVMLDRRILTMDEEEIKNRFESTVSNIYQT